MVYPDKNSNCLIWDGTRYGLDVFGCLNPFNSNRQEASSISCTVAIDVLCFQDGMDV